MPIGVLAQRFVLNYLKGSSATEKVVVVKLVLLCLTVRLARVFVFPLRPCEIPDALIGIASK